MCSQVITEKTLVEQSGSFEQAVMSNDKAALADFCASKASQAHNPDEAQSWAFMRVLFQDDSRRCAEHCRLLDTGVVLPAGKLSLDLLLPCRALMHAVHHTCKARSWGCPGCMSSS